MELGRLWKLSIPEIKVYLRKTETRSMRTRSFVKENPKAGDSNYGEIAHGNEKSRNTAIHEVISRLCYCHHAKLRMHFFRMDWMEEG